MEPEKEFHTQEVQKKKKKLLAVEETLLPIQYGAVNSF